MRRSPDIPNPCSCSAMIGDLAGGSPMADPASKETRSFPSSARLLAPESKSPVLLFFGSFSISNASSVLSSCETTCRMPESTRKDKALVDKSDRSCKKPQQKEKRANLPGHCSLSSSSWTLRDIPSTCKSSSVILQRQLCVPSGSDGERALLAHSVRYLGQRDARFFSVA